MSEQKDIAALTVDRRPIVLTIRDLETLRGGLRGSLARAGDPTYEESRKLWNGMIDRKPALAGRPPGTANAGACVKFARGHGPLPSMLGGGPTCDGAALAW